MQYATKLALGAGAELISGALLSSVSLPTLGAAIAASTGLSTTFGFAGAALIWATAGTMLTKSSPRLLSLAGTGANSLAHSAGRTVGKLQNGLRIFSLLMAGDRANSALKPGPRSIAYKDNVEPLKEASKAAAAGSSTLVNVITTEQEYAAFKASVSAKGMPIIDMDGEAAQKRRDAKEPFEHSSEALAEITRISDQNGRITPDEADDILDRLAKSQSLNADNRRDLLAYLSAQMVTFERETAWERDRLEGLRAETEPHIRQIDANIVERLRGNDELARALHDAQIVSDVDDTLDRVRRSIETVGFDKTLELVRSDPARFGDVDRQRGYFETPQRSHALDNQMLRKTTDVAEKLNDYVVNLKSNSADAEQARSLRELRDRQSELDERVSARDRSLERVKKRIERETLWIEPDVRRQVMKESLEALINSREPNMKKAENAVIAEARVDIKSEREKADAAKNVVDISALLGERKEKSEAPSSKIIATDPRAGMSRVDNVLMAAAFKIDGASMHVPLYKQEYEIKMMTTAISEQNSKEPRDIYIANKRSASRDSIGIGR